MLSEDSLEGPIKTSIRNYLKKLPDSKFFSYHNNRFNESGIPDIIGCHKIKITPGMVGKEIGLFVGIEVKKVGNKPTKLQSARIVELRHAGGAAFVARSVPEAIMGISNYKVYLESIRKG